MRGRIQSKSIDSSAAAKSARMSTFRCDEHARRLVAERVVDRGREVQPAEVAVAVVAEVGDVVLARRLAPERRGPLDEVVLVVVRLVVLAIAVVERRVACEVKPSTGKSCRYRLATNTSSSRRRCAEIVQAAVRVLLEAAEAREVVLPAVVVARAEQAHAELVVLEQEAAEVRRERLDADADAVEVVAVGDVAQVLVDERRLEADVMCRCASCPRADRRSRPAAPRARRSCS